MLKRISAEELEKIIFERKDGEALDLSGCLLENLDLSGWDLRDINFDKSDFRSVRLDGADLSGCSASNAFFRVQALRGRS
ncbi:MAG: pentapeptide repeat-containing protein [Lachnospiraceae bacterium]|nr:pentapeptide repeat-containing protein [Lachnospiraceae bacterium]